MSVPAALTPTLVPSEQGSALPTRRSLRAAERARASQRSKVRRSLAGIAMAGGLAVGVALPAQAVLVPAAAAPAASSVLSVAAQYVGTPYVYGGTTPSGFDCSGYVQYVFKQVGVSLPRTANQQLGATQRISAGEAQPGDLVFFTSGGRAYHVGIYAGDGKMYDAGSSPRSVTKRSIWTSAVVYGRVA
ncbi:C40 family peptidase [Quadrisphaera sp. DSM 44207]|uniref:C40 family peptidase n=1 Tax=Quadrisphaera sp. DSM 44207 TaxID=1881057 RepID=UPI000880501A|nr:C40 family peptidase [Quadrisphaera sp. DSM 44207]SDQ36074.1 Cell wall-associated hydrolase, NlpC family [Quadrisphaera sp. DSM 44207]